MEVLIVNPRGFCAGVSTAFKSVKTLREENPNAKIVILGMLVHNEDAKKKLTDLNIDTLQSKDKSNEALLNELDPSTIVVFTAHGHDEKLTNICKERGIRYFDTTCEKVKANIDFINNALLQNSEVIFIGKKDHPETNAMLSLGKKVIFYDVNKDFDNYELIESDNPLVINQTTLSKEELEKAQNKVLTIAPNAVIKNTICETMLLRQQAIKNISDEYDLIYVVGSDMSSNANELYEIAKKAHPYSKVMRILNKDDVKTRDLEEAEKVAISSSASTPLSVINELYETIRYFK